MRPVPTAEVFHDPETGYFGYRYFFEGRSPHYALAVFATLPATLAAAIRMANEFGKKRAMRTKTRS